MQILTATLARVSGHAKTDRERQIVDRFVGGGTHLSRNAGRTPQVVTLLSGGCTADGYPLEVALGHVAGRYNALSGPSHLQKDEAS